MRDFWQSIDERSGLIEKYEQEKDIKNYTIYVHGLKSSARAVGALDLAEKAEYLEALGLTESGLDKLIKASYSLLGLISYLTAGETESRAWTIKKGTKAPQAAGKIHSDFERGFIKAEIVSYDDLINCGSMTAAKDKGLVRQEGKEYVVQDGDVILFKFNV